MIDYNQRFREIVVKDTRIQRVSEYEIDSYFIVSRVDLGKIDKKM